MTGPRICPECGVNEVPPRCRKCDSCVDGVTIDRALTRPPEVRPLLTVVSCLRRVPERLVDLACTCKVSSGTLWQGDKVGCGRHGETWVTRVTRPEGVST